MITSVCLVVFFLVLSVFTMGLSQGDDSWYLSDASTVSIRHFAGLHYWSPLYLLWLRVLSFVWHDPVWRYFASWGLLTLLLALLPVMLRMRYAWVYTLLVVVSSAPAVSPYIGMFAGVLALLALCLVLRARLSASHALAASCLTCAIIGYCRPEFDYGVFLGAIATLVAVGLEWRTASAKAGSVRPTVRLLSVGTAVIALAGMTAVVMHRALGQRSGAAFAQHFNRRAALRGILPYTIPTWLSDYAERMFGVDQGHNAANGTASIGDFLRAKPGLFLRHMFANIAEPTTVVILLLAGVTLSLPWMRRGDRALRPAGLFLGVIVAPALMDMIVIYPRDHYVMILLPCLVIFALQAIRSERWLQPPMPWVLIAGMALMFYINIGIPRMRWDPPTQDQIGLSKVECMRQIDRTVPAANPFAFDAVEIRDVYLTTPRTQIDQWKLGQWTDFTGWAAAKHPAWIAVDDRLAPHYGVTPAQLQSFLTGDLGYAAHPCVKRAQMTMYAPKM